jgi:hypothetical protein
MADEKLIEKLLNEIETLKKELEELKGCNEGKEEKGEKELIDKEKIVDMIEQTENLIKKTFSILEGAIIGSLEGIKKNLKDGGEEK